MARKRTSLDVLFTRKDDAQPEPEEEKKAETPVEEKKQDKPAAGTAAEEEPAKEPETEAVAKPKPAPGPEPEPEALAEQEPPPEPESEPEPEPDAEPVLEPEPEEELVMEPAPKPVHSGQWEFRTLQVFYDQVQEGGDVFWDYVIDFSDGSQLVGLDAILNSFAEKGWDMVNVFPSYTAPLAAAGESFAMELRVIFKRPGR